MFTLHAPNGLEILYVGYLELEMEFDGVEVPNCGVLVLKDTPATSQQRKDVPGLVGTNVLAQILKFGALLQQRTSSESRTSGPCTSGFVHVAGSYPVHVTNTLVNASKTCFHIQVVNPTSRDVCHKPRTCLGIVHGAVTVTQSSQSP